MTLRREIEGVLRNQRSSSADCICCDGPHIFSYGIDIPERPSIYVGLTINGVEDCVVNSSKK